MRWSSSSLLILVVRDVADDVLWLAAQHNTELHLRTETALITDDVASRVGESSGDMERLTRSTSGVRGVRPGHPPRLQPEKAGYLSLCCRDLEAGEQRRQLINSCQTLIRKSERHPWAPIVAWASRKLPSANGYMHPAKVRPRCYRLLVNCLCQTGGPLSTAIRGSGDGSRNSILKYNTYYGILLLELRKRSRSRPHRP